MHPSVSDTKFGHTPFSDEESVRIRSLINNLCEGDIATRAGPGGQKLNYMEGWKVIARANEVFGFNGWASEVVSVNEDFLEKVGDNSYSCCYTAMVRVTLKDGTYHEDLGTGIMENAKGKGMAIEKAKKEAITDAKKRALRLFGDALGNGVYEKDCKNQIKKRKMNEEEEAMKTLEYKPMPPVSYKPATTAGFVPPQVQVPLPQTNLPNVLLNLALPNSIGVNSFSANSFPANIATINHSNQVQKFSPPVLSPIPGNNVTSNSSKLNSNPPNVVAQQFALNQNIGPSTNYVSVKQEVQSAPNGLYQNGAIRQTSPPRPNFVSPNAMCGSGNPTPPSNVNGVSHGIVSASPARGHPFQTKSAFNASVMNKNGAIQNGNIPTNNNDITADDILLFSTAN